MNIMVRNDKKEQRSIAMEEKKNSLLIRFPSSIPSAYMAQFPAGQGIPAADSREAWSLISREPEWTKVELVNPPAAVLKRLLEEGRNPQNIVLYYDHLPQAEEGTFLRSFHVRVPSLCFYYFFRQREVDVELIHPQPVEPLKGSGDEEEAPKDLKMKNKVCLWIDDRLVAPRYRKGLALTVLKVLKQSDDLEVIWAGPHREDFDQRIRVVPPEEADRKHLWLAADIVVTLSPVAQSMAPLHVRCLANQKAVITDDRGDHGEWVNHALTGFLLSQKGMFPELRRYLLRLLHQRDMLMRFQQNGPLMVEKVLKKR